ncbi:MAG: M64 family metallopeptidase [Phycisphaerae bacterium]
MLYTKGSALFWLCFFLPVLIGLFCEPARGEYSTVQNNGPVLNRVNMVFLGDGYTQQELESTYREHIQTALKHFFQDGQDPYPRYRNFFNVHQVNVVSSESGVDVPPQGIYRNTALDASYYYDGVNRNSLYVDSDKTTQQLDQGLGDASFNPDIVLVTVNSAIAGGGTGTYSVYSGGYSNGAEIALHEMGHSFNNLADEYGGNDETYYGPEPNEVNVTSSPSGEKWSQWLGYDQPGVGVIGVYEGAYYCDRGIYSPSNNSKMRYLGEPFDAVCREKIILDIYARVRPMDGWLDNASLLVDPDSLWVKVVDSNVIKIEWLIGGIPIPDAEGETFRLSDVNLGPGTYTVTARAYDPTDWVRRNREVLEQSIDWTVQLTVGTPEQAFKSPDVLNDNGTVGDNISLADDYRVPLSATVSEELAGASEAKSISDVIGKGAPCGLLAIIPIGLILLGFSLIAGSSLKGD